MPMIKDFKAMFIIGQAKWKIVINSRYIALNKVNNGIPIFLQFKYIDYPMYAQNGEEGIFNNESLEYMYVSAYKNSNHGRIEIHTTENSAYEFTVPYVVAKALQTLGSGSKAIEGASFTFSKKSCDCNIVSNNSEDFIDNMNVENLVAEIKNLEAGNFQEKRYLSNDYDGCECVKTQICKIIKMANVLLVKDNGKCHWDNMEILQKLCYYVHPGEQDRFGWVTGCIDTSKGTIVYG